MKSKGFAGASLSSVLYSLKQEGFALQSAGTHEIPVFRGAVRPSRPVAGIITSPATGGMTPSVTAQKCRLSHFPTKHKTKQ